MCQILIQNRIQIPLNLNDKPFTELEGILAQKQIQMETVRIEHEDQMVVIEQQKAERLADIETEEAVELEKLRQSRDNCANAGNEQAETCRYSSQPMSRFCTFKLGLIRPIAHSNF